MEFQEANSEQRVAFKLSPEVEGLTNPEEIQEQIDRLGELKNAVEQD